MCRVVLLAHVCVQPVHRLTALLPYDLKGASTIVIKKGALYKQNNLHANPVIGREGVKVDSA